jgi:hypothetical protein
MKTVSPAFCLESLTTSLQLALPSFSRHVAMHNKTEVNKESENRFIRAFEQHK